MKVLFISNDPSLLDPTSASYMRMQAYATAIGDLTILMRSRVNMESRTDGPLTVETIPVGKLAVRRLAARAKEIILAKGIEVVSAQDPFEHGLAARMAVAGTSAKLHIQIHTDFLSPWFLRGGILRSPNVPMPVKNRLRRVVADRVLPKADGIRVVSERVKESLMTRYGKKIPEPVVIPIAIGNEMPPAVPLPQHAFPFALITVGRLEPEKRIEDIIEALDKVKDQYPAIGLVVVGDGRERVALMDLVVKKGLMGKVVFTGWKSAEEAWGLIRSAQGYIQASAYEGYSRTLVEAALARVPIVTTDVGIVGEVFKGYDDVLATPPGDPTNLAYHMIALLEDRAASELRIRSAETKAIAHLAQYRDLPQLIASDLARLIVSSTPV